MDRRLRVVGRGVHGRLGLQQPLRRGGDAVGGDRDQQIADRGAVVDLADQLAHEGQVAVDADGAGVTTLVAADEPQQRGLSGTVGADEADVLAVADVERHIVEQGGSAGAAGARRLAIGSSE